MVNNFKNSLKKNSMKMLPKIKESFMMVSNPNSKQSEIKKNNRIIPIDVCKFNENIQLR